MPPRCFLNPLAPLYPQKPLCYNRMTRLFPHDFHMWKFYSTLATDSIWNRELSSTNAEEAWENQPPLVCGISAYHKKSQRNQILIYHAFNNL